VLKNGYSEKMALLNCSKMPLIRIIIRCQVIAGMQDLKKINPDTR
jgi:hypothetical protein